MIRVNRAITATRSAAVLLGAAALALTATPAYAAYEDNGTGCRSGGSGRVCSHVEIDRTTGTIRGRGAGDTDPQSGNVILLDYTRLDRRITEKANPTNVTVTEVARDDRDVASTDLPVSQYTDYQGPIQELCDNGLRTVEYRSVTKYYVRSAGGSTPYSIDSGWSGGRC